MKDSVAWLCVVLLAAPMACAGAPAPPEPSAPPRSTAPPVASTSAAPEPAPADGYTVAAGEIDDHVDEPAADPAATTTTVHPLDGWTNERLRAAIAEDVSSIGSISIGTPNGGALMGGVQMRPGDLWELVDAPHAWGTQETVAYLQTAIQRVAEAHPGTPKLRIGHLSAQHGGPLSPHRSHQSGRDVDVSFYYLGDGQRWYAHAHAGNLDRARTWTFIRALVTDTDVQMVLIDHSIQRLLQEHALQSGADATWVRSIFRGEPGGVQPIIRHARGHATHIHIRFYNPIAQETARRVYPLLVETGRLDAIPHYVHHRVRKGETLGKLARRYGTTIKAIRQANHLRSSLIRAGRVYRIPKPRDPAAPWPPVVIPPRRLPPAQ